MASLLSLLFVLVAASATLCSARFIPAEPVSIMTDSYGNPIMLLREKRTPVNPYPHRAMMFTGYYRPARRSDDGDQATGVYAQGNAVSGGSYLGNVEPNYLKGGPEPETEVSNAEAEAAPALEEPQQDEPLQVEDQEDVPVAYNPAPAAEAAVPEEAAAVPEEAPASQDPVEPVKNIKTGKKTPVVKKPVEVEDDEDDLEEEEPAIPFVPVKGNRRQGYVPNLNNFFPMMFTFPGVANRRAGSSGSPPGIITAIANSYSTGKGGVASSVATAYGGAPQGKKSRIASVA